MNFPNHFTTKFSNYQAKGIFNSGKVTLKHKTIRPYDLKINSNHLVSRDNHYTKQKLLDNTWSYMPLTDREQSAPSLSKEA